MKTCTKCDETKPLDDFYNCKGRKDGKQSQCKVCLNKASQKYNREHREEIAEKGKDRYHNKGGREKQGSISMHENKSCASYLGVVVAERLCRHLFNDVIMMPYGFPGYDMICNRGKRINVKASTIHKQYNKNSTVNRWEFAIRYNKVPDFFLCMAFDNVIDCNPLIAWMIPGNEINSQSKISISSTTIQKWDQWKMDLDNAQACCDLMKGKEPED